jgi:hypothetical protein
MPGLRKCRADGNFQKPCIMREDNEWIPFSWPIKYFIIHTNQTAPSILDVMINVYPAFLAEIRILGLEAEQLKRASIANEGYD